MQTKRGIFLDLKESEYSYTTDGFTFYFSSKKYLEKFKNNVEDYVEYECLKLDAKYNTRNYFRTYFLFSYYKKLEIRGFRIYDKINKKEITENVIIGNTIILY